MSLIKVTVTIPQFEDLVVSSTKLVQGCVDVVDNVSAQADKDFAETYATWTTKPTFVITPASNQSGVISSEVFTMDENYNRVNHGTEAHIGGPTRKKAVSLRKRSPKTTPGSLRATGGAEREGRPVRRGSWYVRGITPRHFDRLVGTRAQHNLNVLTAKMLTQLCT